MTDPIKLTNAEFTLEIGGRSFNVRKANVEKAILYQAKLQEFLQTKEPQSDLKLVAYCTWLVIRDADSSVDEAWVRQNLPGDVSPLEMLGILGFMNQQKVEIGRKVQDSLEKEGVGEKENQASSQ